MKRASLIAAAAVIALLCACGRKDGHTTITTGPDGSVKYPVKGANGDSAQVVTGGGQVKLPAYLPLFPGAVVDSSMTANGGASAGNMVIFHTGSKPDQVIAFYKQKAEGAGFASIFSNQAGDNMMFTAGKEGTEESLQVIATPADGGASVQLTWSQGRKG